MHPIFTVLIALLTFGFLIFIHEFGHYITARLFKVKINEFSIGMGPAIVHWRSKKTDINYKIAAFPIGGYVAMAGEDDESDDPDSFDKKAAWKRFIVTVAGASVNIIFGFAAMLILTCFIKVGGTQIGEFVHTDADGNAIEISSSDSGLMKNDIILSVDGKRVYIADELSYEIMRRGYEPVDVLVKRGDSEVLLENVIFPTAESQGQTFGVLDFAIYEVEKNPLTVVRFSWHKSILIVRMCWESIFDLITGRYSLAAISGPVGISTALGEAAATGGILSLLYMVVVISINLGIMNLLPVPALDGGRLVVLLVEMITKKRLPKKVEGIINASALGILLVFSAIIMVKDVVQLIIESVSSKG